MMNFKHINPMKSVKKSIALLFVMFFLVTGLRAQDNVMYNMRRLPQYTKDNVAKQPDCKLYIGMPVLSSTFISTYHSGFTFKDAIVPDPHRADTFMIDIDGMEAAMKEKNYISTTMEFDILSFGFRLPNSYYFSFGMANKTTMNFQYPRSILEVRNGNYRPDGTPLDFTFGQDFTNYFETSFGLSKEFYNNMSVGLRVKLLSGMANFEARNIGMKWYTDVDDYDYTFATEMLIREANIVAGADATQLNTGDTAAFTQFVEDLGNSIEDFMDEKTTAFDEGRIGDAGLFQLILGQNFGLGFDLGYDYQINKQWNVSASITDLGFIKWKSNPIQVEQSGEMTFTGLDVAHYISNYYEAENADVSLADEFFADMSDTLSNFISKGKFTNDSYKTSLTSKLYIGGTYSPVKWFDLGALYRGTFYNKSVFSAATLSANLHFLRGWGLTASYTLTDGLYNNIGAGLVSKFGPLQFYILSDNIAPFYWTINDSETAEKWIRNTKRITVHTGLNLTICGYKKDIPLLD